MHTLQAHSPPPPRLFRVVPIAGPAFTSALTRSPTPHPGTQGYVAELASKSPADLTKLFEEVSGSGELKPEYERLEAEKKQAEEDQVFNHPPPPPPAPRLRPPPSTLHSPPSNLQPPTSTLQPPTCNL